jgi:hypothetical protein
MREVTPQVAAFPSLAKPLAQGAARDVGQHVNPETEETARTVIAVFELQLADEGFDLASEPLPEPLRVQPQQQPQHAHHASPLRSRGWDRA